MAKKQIGKILLAKLEVEGENSDSLSGCSQVYSRATSRLRRSQIASPESFFFSLQVLTNLVLRVLQSAGKLSCFRTSSPTNPTVELRLGLQWHQAFVDPLVTILAHVECMGS